MNGNRLCNVFAILVGCFLIVEGIWGMFSPIVFSVLSTNKTHAGIHIILGVVGLYFASQGGARQYCTFLGILLLAVGILHFIPGPDELITKLLNVNNAVAYLNITVGALALILSMVPSPQKKARNSS